MGIEVQLLRYEGILCPMPQLLHFPILVRHHDLTEKSLTEKSPTEKSDV